MSNTICFHCLMIVILIIGFVVMMVGLSLIPNPPTRKVLGTTEEPPIDRTALVLGSYGFRLAMGGMTVDLIIIAGYLYSVWRENRDAVVEPLEVQPVTQVQSVPQVQPVTQEVVQPVIQEVVQPVPQEVVQPVPQEVVLVKPLVPILKKGPVIEHVNMRPRPARSEQPEGPSRTARSLVYWDDQTALHV